MPERLIRFPFVAPADFLAKIGYEAYRTPAWVIRMSEEAGSPVIEAGPRRLVALCWQCGGDELEFYDGLKGGAGILDHWPWLDWMQRLPVMRWLDAHRINLGSSDGPNTHWLIFDRKDGSVHVAPHGRAQRIVQEQRLGAE